MEQTNKLFTKLMDQFSYEYFQNSTNGLENDLKSQQEGF